MSIELVEAAVAPTAKAVQKRDLRSDERKPDALLLSVRQTPPRSKKIPAKALRYSRAVAPEAEFICVSGTTLSVWHIPAALRRHKYDAFHMSRHWDHCLAQVDELLTKRRPRRTWS
jgi:hypothetical protein